MQCDLCGTAYLVLGVQELEHCGRRWDDNPKGTKNACARLHKDKKTSAVNTAVASSGSTPMAVCERQCM